VETSARMAAGLPEHNEYVDPGQTGTISSRPRRCSQAAISCACPAGSTRSQLRKKAAASEGAMGRRSSSGDHRAGQGAGRVARRAVMQLRGEVPRLDAHERSVLPSGKIGPRTRVRIRSICHRVRVRCPPSAPRIIAASGGAPVGQVTDLVVVARTSANHGVVPPRSATSRVLVEVLQRHTVDE
jgi:hypothetical protein